MTTATDPRIRVEPNGLIVVCSYCVKPAKLEELNAQYPDSISHSVCPRCERRLYAEMEAK